VKYSSAAAFRQALDQRLKNEATALRHALESTFNERAIQPLPDSLPPPPAIWGDPYRRLADTVDIEPDLSAAFTRAAMFLDPVLTNHTQGRWDAQHRTWLPRAK
jgi:hypothetical protein